MNEILMRLLNENSVTDKLDTFVIGEKTYPALVATRQIPASLQNLVSIVQLYRTSPVGAGQCEAEMWTANCRSNTEQKSEQIAWAVRNELNRIEDDDDFRSYFRCIVQPPIWEDDNLWNTPVEIRIENNKER